MTQFRTGVDIAKRFMGNISGLAINPIVGDLVEVYRDSDAQIIMRVVSRNWCFINGSQPTLEVWLAPTETESIAAFTKRLQAMGF